MRLAAGVEGHEEADNCIKSAPRRAAANAGAPFSEEPKEPKPLEEARESREEPEVMRSSRARDKLLLSRACDVRVSIHAEKTNFG